jgi:Icc-related predicted phosphoesterase
MRIWHISDTHTYHGLLSVPDVDMVICSGDISIPRDPFASNVECFDFLEWYQSLPIKHKILIAGNHDIAIERRFITPADISARGIVYLENNATTIEGLKIWGSPITPSFGTGWAFNKKREKCDDVWQLIPEDADIVVTHGPAKGVLDLSYNLNNDVERCGCSALGKTIRRIQPKLFCFGHIHNCKDIINAGQVKLSGYETIYSNGSVVTDGKFGAVSSNGNIFEL